MKSKLIRIMQVSVFFTFFGCVSLALNDTKVVRSKSVQFVPPSSISFFEVAPDHLDHLWKNPKNGNSISYLSDCSDPTDPDLDSIEQGVLHNVERLKILSHDDITYNDREALHSRARGRVDGVETQMEMMVFKKNGCIYVLNYVGVAKEFEQNAKDFAEFLDQFRAP